MTSLNPTNFFFLALRMVGCPQNQLEMSLRIWLDRMDPQQFTDVSEAIQTLHRAMKNVMEIVFAASPLLALSTHG